MCASTHLTRTMFGKEMPADWYFDGFDSQGHYKDRMLLIVHFHDHQYASSSCLLYITTQCTINFESISPGRMDLSGFPASWLQYQQVGCNVGFNSWWFDSPGAATRHSHSARFFGKKPFFLKTFIFQITRHGISFQIYCSISYSISCLISTGGLF